MINAVVLAGRPNQGALSQEKASCEALIDIAGKPMVSWVIDALMHAESINQVAVVAPADARKVVEALGAQWVEAGDSLTENVRRGAASLPRDQALLMVSGDIPLLKEAMVEDFIRRAESTGADIVYPIVDKNLCEQKYPLVRRTYVGLKDGTYTGGNLIYLRPGALVYALRFLQKAYQARKKPWRLAAMLGWKFILQLLMHNAKLEEVEQKASQLLGVKAKAVVVPYPEIGIDIDKQDDLRLARSALQ